jgi:hypothetical protein
VKITNGIKKKRKKERKGTVAQKVTAEVGVCHLGSQEQVLACSLACGLVHLQVMGTYPHPREKTSLQHCPLRHISSNGGEEDSMS